MFEGLQDVTRHSTACTHPMFLKATLAISVAMSLKLFSISPNRMVQLIVEFPSLTVRTLA